MLDGIIFANVNDNIVNIWVFAEKIQDVLHLLLKI